MALCVFDSATTWTDRYLRSQSLLLTEMRLLCLLFALAAVSSAHQCDDSPYSCPDSATCCKLDDGEWGCCPMVNAVCCEDHVHCCPSGNVCDVQAAHCIAEFDIRTPMIKKHRAVKKNEFEEIVCPDHKSKCPEGSTCCLLTQGKYGCCPAVDATCCNDHLHCCPHGLRCDPSGQRCIDAEGWEAVPWLRKFSSTPIKRKSSVSLHKPHSHSVDAELPQELRRVHCGIGTSCPAMTTCCPGENGEGVCCPLQNGVCCSDFCCPSGWQCVEGLGHCERAARFVPFV